MKNITVFFTKILIVTCLVFFFSCKKDDSPSPSSSGGTSTTTPMTDVCGAGSSSYYWPMKIGNSWSMEHLPSLESRIFNLVKDTIIFSNSYFIMEVKTTNYTDHYYLRYNVSKDLLLLNNDSLFTSVIYEELLVPYNPTINQTWVNDKEVYKVVDLASTFNTQLCNYSGVLKIDVDKFPNDGIRDYSIYFKKGLGYLGFYNTSDTLYLKSVVLN